MVESRRSLAGTSYIAREARGLIATRLEWTTSEGRDPTDTPGFFGYQTTNGSITADLRRFWGLNAALHGDEADPERRLAKNRSDMRHHALDAMVIASTLPWAAVSSNAKGGWRRFDGRGREDIDNPLRLTLPVVREWMEKITPEVRDPIGHNAKHYDTTLLGKREVEGESWFVARDELSALKSKDARNIYPKELGDYVTAAWKLFEQEGGMPGKNGIMPEGFINRLCFSHFQRWRALGGASFAWPDRVKIRIRSVRYRRVKDPDAVMGLRRNRKQKNPDDGPFVNRTGFREAWIVLKPDGSLDSVVRVPHFHGDPLAPREKRPANAIVIRRGGVVRLKKAPYPGAPAGEWRVLVTGESQVKLVPALLAKGFKSNEDKALAYRSWGIPETGWNPAWKTLVQYLDLAVDKPPLLS